MAQNNAFRLLDATDVLRSGTHVIIAHQKHWMPATTADLSADEKQRYDAFENTAAAASFNHRRSLLRQVLSIATGHPKNDIAYEVGRFGKIKLPNNMKQKVYFNISQGADLCAISISRTAEVGIDIEANTPGDAMNDVVPFLHPDERAYICGQADQKTAFLDLWVQKEAVAKCFGFGFSKSADSWSCLDAFGQHSAQRFELEEHRMCLCTIYETPVSFWRCDRRLA